jgi:molybdopterin converting factor subunit 1
MSKRVRILLFASLKEKAGFPELNIELPDNAIVNDLITAIVAAYPSISKDVISALVAVDKEYADGQSEIPDGAEVAIFPPVSGGVYEVFPTLCRVQVGEINIQESIDKITLLTTGAICMFTGVVRGFTERDNAHKTDYLEYEAYIPMAELKMLQIANDIRKQWPSVEGISIIQRIGCLEIGAPTVLIACSAAHRDTGVFDAARYGIDKLKQIVPVWKRESGQDGLAWIEGDYFPKPGE